MARDPEELFAEFAREFPVEASAVRRTNGGMPQTSDELPRRWMWRDGAGKVKALVIGGAGA